MDFWGICCLLAATGCFLIKESSGQLVAPPSAFQEHWHGHYDVVSRVYFNNDVAVYYDQGVSKLLQWPFSFLTAVWQHVKSLYGITTPNALRLYAIIHSDRLDVGKPVTYMEEETENRNMLDLDLGELAQWPIEVTPLLDVVIKQVAEIVVNTAYGVAGNPMSNVSGTRFSDIFVYDVYKGMGRYMDATRFYNKKLGVTEDFPRNGTYWFKNWFYPIYQRYGGSTALRRFFYNLYVYFPYATVNGYPTYNRQLNLGEFVHFWSGAANKNLKPLATTAFGWTNATEAEFLRARTTFNRFTYPN